MLYSQSDEGRGFVQGNRGELDDCRLTREHDSHYQQEAWNTSRELGRRGSHHARPSHQNSPIECWYYGNFGHYMSGIVLEVRRISTKDRGEE